MGTSGEKNPRAGDSMRPAEAPSATAPSRARTPRSRLTHVVAAITVGLVAGVFVGLNLRSTPDSAPPPPVLPSPTRPTASTASAHLQPGPRPPAVALDLGTAEAASTLKGPWKPKVTIDDRSAAVVDEPGTSIVLQGDPKGGAKLVAVVARAVHIEPNERITLVARVSGKLVGRWTLGPAWGLYAGPWPAGQPFDGGQVLDLGLEGTDELVREQGERPGVALDYLQVLAPTDRDAVDLGSAAGCARLLDGFWEVEPNALGNRPAAWSRGARSRIGLLLAPTAGNYALRLRVGPYVPIAPLEVKVVVNGKPAAVQSIDGLNDYVLTVARAALVDGANIVELQYAQTARPADHGGNDTRTLALRLFGLALEPAAP